MSVSRIVPPGGANDFNLNITGPYTVAELDAEKSAGSYSITSSGNDATIDIYAFNATGANAGYTGTKAFTASSNFNKLVVLGGTTGDVLGFSFKTTYSTTAETNETTAGPFITAMSTTSFPNTSSVVTVTGGNFASDITGAFTSANTTSTYTASITYTSATTVAVGRPVTFPVAFNPYTLTLSNPGINNPVGSNVNKVAVNAGVLPVWTSPSIISYVTGASTSFALTATDADTTTLTYSISSGTLPTGLSLDGATGVISGTPTTSQQTVTFAVTDGGGNSVTHNIKFNAKPVFTSSANPTKMISGSSYTYTGTVTDDTATSGITWSSSGTLPTGISFNASTGVYSGTPTGSGSFTPILTATDVDGGATSLTITFAFATLTIVSLTTVGSGTWTLPSTAAPTVNYLAAGGGGGGGEGGPQGGGGGAGNLNIGTLTLTPGTTYNYTVGGGGAGVPNNQAAGGRGGDTTFVNSSTVYARGGGGGEGEWGRGATDGGCGGGGAIGNTAGRPGNAGVAVGGTSYFSNGGNQSGAAGGGGGGANGNGGVGTPGAGRSSSLSGSAYTYCTGGAGRSSSGNGANATTYGSGGESGYDSNSGSGFQGIIVLNYFI
jgi:hypothetical protein